MNIYEWIKQTFLCIAGDIDIEFAVVNDEIVVEGDTQFRRFDFSSFNSAVEWAMINRNRYVVDDMHVLYIGAVSGVTIYIKDVNKE